MGSCKSGNLRTAEIKSFTHLQRLPQHQEGHQGLVKMPRNSLEKASPMGLAAEKKGRLREGRVANRGQNGLEWAGFYVAPEREGKLGPRGGKGLGVRPGRQALVTFVSSPVSPTLFFLLDRLTLNSSRKILISPHSPPPSSHQGETQTCNKYFISFYV